MTTDQTQPQQTDELPSYEELVRLYNRNVFVRQQLAFDNGQLTAQVHELTGMLNEKDYEIAQLREQIDTNHTPEPNVPTPPHEHIGPPPENGDTVTKSAIVGLEPEPDQLADELAGIDAATRVIHGE